MNWLWLITSFLWLVIVISNLIRGEPYEIYLVLGLLCIALYDLEKLKGE